MLRSNARVFGHRARIVLLAIASSALILLSVSGPAEAGSRCITLDVEAPIVLPNGAVHPPGALTLCDYKAVSPVSTLHKTFVDGHPVAMLASHKTRSEGGETIPPHALFNRTPEGQLELIGYVLPGTGRSVTYHLNEAKKPVRRKSRGSDFAKATAKEPTQETETFVVMAARTPR